MFTDAPAQMVTANSTAYDVLEHPHQPTTPAPLATTPPQRSAHAQAAAADLKIVMPGSTGLADLSTPHAHNTARSAQTASKTASAASLPETAASHPTGQVPVRGDALTGPGAASLARAAPGVCVDKVQPVLLPQAWERQGAAASGGGLTLQQCQLLNVSVCGPSVQMSGKGQGFLVVLYNSLAWERTTEPIRLPLVAADPASPADWLVTGQL